MCIRDSSIDKPIKDFTKKELDIVLYGSKDLISYKLESRSGNVMKKTEFIEGVCTLIERRYMETSSQMSREWYATFLAEAPCPTCGGRRLNEQALSVRVGGIKMCIRDRSGTINAMEMCARTVGLAFAYVDCHVTAVVQEYMIKTAKRLHEEGKTIQEIKDVLSRIVETTDTLLLPNDLQHLKRGGRLTPVSYTHLDVYKRQIPIRYCVFRK